MSRTIVFTRTKRGADRVAKHLEGAGVTAAAIHGDKSQGQRERALAAFKAGACRALVATDIAARGIDIDAVSHVVNFELPYVAEAYVHRIGRTARAGASGQAISLCADDERPLVRDIQKLTRQTIAAVDRRRDQSLRVMAKATAELSGGRDDAHGEARSRSAGGRGGQGQGGRGRNGGGGGAGQGAAGRSQGGQNRGGQGDRSQAAPRAPGSGTNGANRPHRQGANRPAGAANAGGDAPRRWNPMDA